MSVYQCTRCGYWSRRRDAVIEHLWVAHRGERPIRIDDFAVRPEAGYGPEQSGIRPAAGLRREALQPLAVGIRD